jgi:hypothetical protein
MVDEYITGVELGVELIMTQGKCAFSSLMECEKTPPPIFQGLGRFYPSHLSSTQQEKAIQECIHAAQHLHLDNGVLDFDLIYNYERGPLILEINTRMGGNSVGFMHQVVFGMDLIEQVLLCACQSIFPIDMPHPKTPAAFAKMVLARNSGIFDPEMNSQKYTELLQEALGDLSPFLASARCTAIPGNQVIGATEANDVPTILGIIIATGETWDQAKDRVNLIHATATLVLNSHVLPLVNDLGDKDTL